ncbi:PREDICTED: uncharacterized protein LOC108762277 [Trachymyrmex cornetzi]|uniref:uncharacterized protein LOC108762277 n=1 Tax=Trachymyrmex cornetzi TaxID=471704 RepID=UPI00084F697F|nr:PREDICTED: uncharacterized protein LOC108762277 [Trachymyrmex cornetzi]
MKSKIDINSLEIRERRPRKARTGALLEIPGAEGAEKPNKLADKLKEALGEEQNVLISRPEKTAEIRLRDLEESMTKENIITALMIKEDCPAKTFKPGEISTSLQRTRDLIAKMSTGCSQKDNRK